MAEITRQPMASEVLGRLVRVGVDLAKQVILVHAVDIRGMRQALFAVSNILT